MHPSRMAAAVLIVAACIAPLVSAWGPLSHQLFACALVTPADCVLVDGSFVLGAFSPDAFKTQHRQMHDFGFASAQVDYARSLPQPASPSHFNATAFSLGFVAHLLQDHVGHHANGFLNPLEDHPLELAVDALEWKNKPTGFAVHTASDAAYAFVANATAAWNASLAITAAQAAQQWQQFGLFILAEQAIISLDSTFQNDIIKYDVCNATDWAHAQANLFLAQKWSQTAVQIFVDAMSSPSTPAAEAIKRSLAWVEGAFAANGGNGCAK